MAKATGRPGEGLRGMPVSRIVAAFSLAILMAAPFLLYSRNAGRIMALGLPGVLIIGGACILLVKHLKKKGGASDTRSRDAERRAESDETVGAFLDGLPEGNFAIHDFDSGQGTIDHILVGPKGIFTIETKSQRGVVEFDGAALLCDGRPFDEDLLEQVRARCLLAGKILENWQIRHPRPEPLIVFTNALVRIRGKARGVAVVSVAHLPGFLGRLPDRMTIPEAGRVYDRMRSAVRLPSIM